MQSILPKLITQAEPLPVLLTVLTPLEAKAELSRASHSQSPACTGAYTGSERPGGNSTPRPLL